MAYKRNPISSEGICSLSRFVMKNAQNASQTASVHRLERSLDDSANRRLTMLESFMATDAILILLQNVTRGIVKNEPIIQKNMVAKMLFIATETS